MTSIAMFVRTRPVLEKYQPRLNAARIPPATMKNGAYGTLEITSERNAAIRPITTAGAAITRRA
ncbi:hypothetical protein, partial [Burkholderia vietnamiensis]|uniref:hypothetical protein n=1 Tax=Burkholderia vietnamiensis TaxID=60552 RepID=UPI001C8691D2